MIVSASTRCLPHLELQPAIEMLQDLDFVAVEISLDDTAEHCRPAELVTNEDHAIQLLRHTHRLDISGYWVNLQSRGAEHVEQFTAICRIAKATKVVNLSVPSGHKNETALNEEIEQFQKLVEIAADHGIRVSVRMMVGCHSEDPATLAMVCKHVDGLGVTYDPSVPIVTGTDAKGFDPLIKDVHNVLLRDTKPDAFQVSVGQGKVDYGKIINQLQREKYDRALTIDMEPMEGIDHRVELRKMRRLMETLT